MTAHRDGAIGTACEAGVIPEFTATERGNNLPDTERCRPRLFKMN